MFDYHDADERTLREKVPFFVEQIVKETPKLCPKGGSAKSKSFWIPSPSVKQIEDATDLARDLASIGRPSRSVPKKATEVVDNDVDTLSDGNEDPVAVSHASAQKRKSPSTKSVASSPPAPPAKKQRAAADLPEVSPPVILTPAPGASMKSALVVNSIMSNALTSMKTSKALMSMASVTAKELVPLLEELEKAIKDLSAERDRLDSKVIRPYFGADD